MLVVVSVAAAVINALSSLVFAAELRFVAAVGVLGDALSLALLLVVVAAEMVGGRLAWVSEVFAANGVLVLAAAFSRIVTFGVLDDCVSFTAVGNVFSEVFQICQSIITAILSMAAKLRVSVFSIVRAITEAEIVVGYAIIIAVGLIFLAAPVVAVEDFVFSRGVVGGVARVVSSAFAAVFRVLLTAVAFWNTSV